MTTTAQKKPTQEQMYYDAVRKAGEVNELFMWLTKNGITKEDLITNIARRPSLWQRFEGFVDKLPSRGASASTVTEGLLPIPA